MSGPARPRIAALGLTSWDRLLVLDRQPTPAQQAVVRGELLAPGGTTTNACVQLARLGAAVTAMAAVGDDDEGRAVLAGLRAEGIDTAWCPIRPGERTDRATVLVTLEPFDRAIIWHPGATLRKGDRIDVAALFGHDLVVLDFPDVPLLRFLTDLPAHVDPRTRLLGTFNYLADPAIPDRLDLALRHDCVVGSEHDLLILTGQADAEAAMAALQRGMVGSTLRAAAVTAGVRGSILLTAAERWRVPAFPVTAVDPTGAGDAYLAGIAWGMAHRWDWPRTGRFAAALGALATRALGAQTAYATLGEAETLLAAHGSAVSG
jgi:sugar/nucleoside kinase (ribokinase family)